MQTIVFDLRQADLVTNEEEANLKFNAVHFLRKYMMKPHVLPVCFFAGKIQRALDEGRVDSLSGKVLREGFHLFLALLAEVGLLDTASLPHDSLERLKRLILVKLHQLGQTFPPAVGTAFDGADGAVAHVGGLLVGKSRRPHQKQRLALFVGKLGERHGEILHHQAPVMGRFFG